MAMSEHDHEPDQQPAEPGGPIRWTQASWPGTPSSAAQSTIDQMTDQLQAVIGAAERAAEAIRRDAEEQARLHLVEAQRQADRLTAERVGLISELTDDLIRHAANVRDHSEQMVRALEAAINSVTDKLDQPALSDRFEPAGQPPFGARPPAAPAPARPPEPAPPAQPVQPAPPDPAVQPAGAAQPVQPAQPTAPTTPAVPYTPPAAPGEQGPHPSGVYTDIVGAPPPPPPARASAGSRPR
jgi:vacuolar-type H+-ATPase subunit H